MVAMSETQKEAMAKGRRQARAVREYLTALEKDRRRGPKMTPEKLRKRIADTGMAIEDEESPVKRLELIQSRMDDEDRLEELEARTDIEELEARFVDVADEYGDRKGITYMAWRELGVAAATLRRAGISRAS